MVCQPTRRSHSSKPAAGISNSSILAKASDTFPTMTKDPPFVQERTYFNRDARAWIETNRNWSRAQTDLTLDTLWFVAGIRELYRTHRNGANASTISRFVPGQVPIPRHPYLAVDRAAAKRNKQRPPERDAAGGLLVAPGLGTGAGAGPVIPAGVVPPAVAAPLAPSAPVAVPGPAVPAVPTVPAAPSAPAASDGVGLSDEKGAPTAPEAPANQYFFDFWPPLPWDVDPDAREVPRTELIKASHPEKPEEIDKFMTSRPLIHKADDTAWTGARYIASGSYEAAGLWCRTDENNNIIERMVVKDCAIAPDMYSKPRWWYDRLPSEIALHRRLDRKRKRDESADVGFEHLVEHYGYRLMMRMRRYRLYLKYYAGGDLQFPLSRLLLAWRKEGGVLTEERLLKAPQAFLSQLRTVPEGFLWHIFRSLVKAYLILHHGTTSSKETDPDWKPITHLDLSYNNAFLEASPEAGEPANIVLADLGLGFIERSTPPVADGEEPLPSDNPYEFVENKPLLNHPRERHSVICDPPLKIGEKTDVWKLGALIWEQMTAARDEDSVMREDYPRLDGFGRAIVDHRGEPVLDKYSVTSGRKKARLDANAMFPTPWRWYPAADRYSDDLKQLVRDCLHWNPAERKSLKELDRDIEWQFSEDPTLMHGVSAALTTLPDPFKTGMRLLKR